MNISRKMYYDFKNSDRYLRLSGFRSKYKSNIARESTDLVLEGYPRSANTFAKTVVELANPKIIVAHHMHSRAQVLRGAAYEIPTVVLLRSPKDAIASLIIKNPPRRGDLGKRISEYAYYYSRFHNGLENYVDSILFFDFDFVTKFPSRFISFIDCRYDLCLDFSRSDAEIIRTVFDLIALRNAASVGGDSRKLAIPSKEKDIYKKILNSQIEKNEYYRDAYNSYLKLVDFT